ncbi:hypothetical protein MIND_00025600 [Mycena indigotica]|uniref:Transmembrane protein n=1 Tax=Mycena indigotica TaxID=2126181 RepID=A0A8H6TCD9_9AGAR|nr:uncharacterized protein MIND_00025600 [Mycena indigotica]KAF7315113.1 hypothetical protein MIND_00025600 [Mycena indigotica]
MSHHSHPRLSNAPSANAPPYNALPTDAPSDHDAPPNGLPPNDPPYRPFPTGNGRPPSPPSAQSFQNQMDEKTRGKALKDLTQSWMDRLQLISVISTFFASTEAGLLDVTVPLAGVGGGEFVSAAGQVAAASILAALVLHIWASILSFLGAFFVVRYRLREAKEEQKEIIFTEAPPPDPGLPSPLPTSALRSSLVPVWTSNPHVEEIGPFHLKPPTHLLSKIHNLCILLTFAGFGLAVLGILAIAWGQSPTSVGVVITVSTAACFVGAVWVFV